MSAEGAGFVFAAIGLSCDKVRLVEGLKLGRGADASSSALRSSGRS